MTVDDPGGGVSEDSVRTPVIVDGLLCSILKAISRSASQAELINVIEKVASESEVKTSWQKLFTMFDEAMDPTRKKRIIDIERETTKKRIIDLVSQLSKIERENDIRVMFAFPWSYVIKEFESETEERGRLWQEEVSKDYESKINNLEKKMDKKHLELLAALNNMVQNIGATQQQVSFTSANQRTYAGVAGGRAHVGPGQHQQGPEQPQHMNRNSEGGQSHHHGVGPIQQNRVGRSARVQRVNSFSGQHQLQVPQPQHPLGGGEGANGRNRSPSVKRARNEDGSATNTSWAEQGHTWEQPKQLNQKKKSVTGTSNSVAAGRKMRSPPADIFVWGVHPDTTVEDIINDLGDSGIKVEQKDIVKKSKPEAFLVSYKISVQAADLSRALDPSIWPLRVKVREFIHYARRNQNRQVDQPVKAVQHCQDQQVQGQYGQGHQRESVGTVGVHSHPGQHVVLNDQVPRVQVDVQQQLYPNLSNKNLWNVLCGPGVPNPNL